jgi:hypothetical protein
LLRIAWNLVNFVLVGDFAAGGRFKDACLPCIEVDNLGILALPLSEVEAKKLVKVSA